MSRRRPRLALALLRWPLLVVFSLLVWAHVTQRVLVTPVEAGDATWLVNLVLRLLFLGYAWAGISEVAGLRARLVGRGVWARASGFAAAAFLLVPLWSQGVFWVLWRRWGGGVEGFAAEAVYLEPSVRAAPWVLELVVASGLLLVAALWFSRPGFRGFWARLTRPTLLGSALLAAYFPLSLATSRLADPIATGCQDTASLRPRPPWLLCQSIVHSRPPLGFAIPYPTPTGRSVSERDLGHVLWTRAFLFAQKRPHSPLLAGVWEYAGSLLSLSLWSALLTVVWRGSRALLARLGGRSPPSPL